MSAARRGADFERRVRRHLERDGWFVIRSAGSRGPLDLVALRRDGHAGCEVRLIQCKVRQTHFTLNDWSLLEEAALDAGATAWLACRDRAASRYAIILKPAAPKALSTPKGSQATGGRRGTVQMPGRPIERAFGRVTNQTGYS